MDLITIIVVVVLTLLSLGAIVGLEIHARKTQAKVALADDMASRSESLSN